MRIFGLEIGKKNILAPVNTAGGWGGFGATWTSWGGIREVFAGAWQRNIEIRHDTVLRNPTMFSCITLIASDISKLGWKLQRYSKADDIWEDDSSPAFNQLMVKPNRYQNRIQFTEQWMLSKLSRGNTYALKQRDLRNVVTALYILDPTRVMPLVDDDGNVYYQIATDNLTGVGKDGIVVPAEEIIHDRFNCLFHPLVGLSPIFACGLPAMLGQHMLENSARFFKNGALPSGILTAPGSISNETAARLKTDWDSNYGGKNVGRVAVLGDNLKFEQMVMTAVDAQVIDQLKFSDEKICSTFHVPQYKVGVGAQPTYNNIEALQQDYYSTCLQSLIETFELGMDQGLALPADISICIDLDGLLRMDSATLMTTVTTGIKGTLLSPNEGRKKLGYKPTEGGDSVLSQQQNYSLAALAKRDALPDPFIITTPSRTPDPNAQADPAASVNDGGDPAASTESSDQAAKDAAAKAMQLIEQSVLESFDLEMET